MYELHLVDHNEEISFDPLLTQQSPYKEVVVCYGKTIWFVRHSELN